MVLATIGTSRVDARNDKKNVGDVERAISAFAGAVLAAYGLKRRDLPGLAMTAIGAALVGRGATGRCMVYRAMGVSSADNRPGNAYRSDVTGAAATVNARRAVKIERSVIVDRTPGELYAFWRRFDNLPRFMEGLESVDHVDTRRTHWVARGPANRRIEWDAELVNDIPDRLIAWKTVGDPDVAHAGSVHFTAVGDGTEVRFVLDYEPPGGRLGQIGARLAGVFGETPDQKIREDLGRLKTVLETESQVD